jgi:hypothetical protein
MQILAARGGVFELTYAGTQLVDLGIYSRIKEGFHKTARLVKHSLAVDVNCVSMFAASDASI